MGKPSSLVFFHNPYSRASMTRALLEELGVDFELCVIDFRQDEQLSADYRAINPMGKVPAIRHHGTVVTETVAIFIHLADACPQAGLAPALDAPERGSYLRWMVFYAACFEPAVTDRSLKRDPAPRMQSPYGDFDTMLNVLFDQLESGPWLLGDTFSAADVLWGNALRWVSDFNITEMPPVIADYVKRVTTRPAETRARRADQVLAVEMGLAAA